MRILYLMLVNLMIGTFSCLGQSLEWVNNFGGLSDDQGTAMVKDNSGNVYIVGAFEGTVDVDISSAVNILESQGETDIYIIKLNSEGQLMWVKSAGGLGYDAGTSIAIDEMNYLYITGEFEETIDLDANSEQGQIVSMGQRDVFFLKLDENGNFITAKSIGGLEDDYNSRVNMCASGDMVITGSFYRSMTVVVESEIVEIENDGARQIFVIKSDAEGNFKWIKIIGGDYICLANSVYSDEFDNIHFTGFFEGEIDFDPGPDEYIFDSQDGYDVFVEKLDANGNFIWSYLVEGDGYIDYGNDLVVDDSGSVYVTGGFEGTKDFDFSEGSNIIASSGSRDVFVLKIDSAGYFQWVKTIGSVGLDFSKSIKLDHLAKLYITGSFSETVDFNPNEPIYNLTSLGDLDIFVVSWDTNASFNWAERAGGPFEDYGISVLTDTHCNSWVTGFFTDALSYGSSTEYPEIIGAGGHDIYVMKLNVAEGQEKFDKPLTCFPNPTNAEVSIDLNEIRKEVEIRVYNCVGQVVYNSRYSCTDKIRFTLSGQAGIYFIELASGDSKRVVRVQKI